MPHANIFKDTSSQTRSRDAERCAELSRAAVAAVTTALDAEAAAYDRRRALRRFHRLSPQTIAAETKAAAGAVVAELERALRVERARINHWSYDLNRHIGLVVAYRAEKVRLERLIRVHDV